MISLRQLLQAYQGYAASRLLRPEMEAYEHELAARMHGPAFDSLPAVGTRLPDFTFAGLGRSLNELLTNGPVILKFYRSYLCPFCTLELKAYQRAADEIQRAGASFVAITSDSAEQITLARSRDMLTFPIVPDADEAIARRFGLTYQPGPAERQIMHSIGMQQRGAMVIPALLVIDQNRRVRFAHCHPNPAIRAEPADVVAAVAAMALADATS